MEDKRSSSQVDNATKLKKVFAVLRQFPSAKDKETAEKILFDCFKAAGFPAGRLYYLDDKAKDTLILANWYGIKPRKTIEKVITINHDATPISIASYAVTNQKKPRPLVVRVRPGEHESASRVRYDNGIPYLQIKKSSIRSYFNFQKTRDWIDFPLMAGKKCFGKLSLDTELRSKIVEHRHFELIRLLFEPITVGIASCSWFTGTSLPTKVRQEIILTASHVNSLTEYLQQMRDKVMQIFNVKNCSIFLVHSPCCTDSALNSTQPEKLVLWTTSFKKLVKDKNLGFYLKGEGLTGFTWKNGTCHFESDIRSSSAWYSGRGKLNDSRNHRSWAASVISNNNEILGLIRLPEGDRRTLLETQAKLLYNLCTSIVGPALENIMERERTSAYQAIVGIFQSRLKTILEHTTPVGDEEVWQFILQCCEKVFGDQTGATPEKKHFILNKVTDAGIQFFRQNGGMVLDESISQALKTTPVASSASDIVRKTTKPLMLTDLDAAAKFGAYLPLVKDAKMAAIVPVDGGKKMWGLIAVVSNRYDMIAKKDLEILKHVAIFSRFFWELGRIMSQAQGVALEQTAYQVKTPCQLLYGATVALEEYLKNKEIDPAGKEILEQIKSWTDWIFSCTERVLCQVPNDCQYLHVTRLSLAELMQRTERVATHYLQAGNPKRIKLDFKPSCDLSRFVEICPRTFCAAFVNLFENAIKATFIEKSIGIQWNVDDNGFSVSIKNFGRGMDAERLQLLNTGAEFRHTHYQIGSYYPEGAGFGITVARSHIARIGGALQFRSKENEYFEVEISVKH